MTGFFVVTSLVTGRVFLTVWMHGEFPPEAYWILVSHVITFSILAVTVVAWHMNESYRVASLNAIFTVIWLIISAPLMIVVADRWQIAGIAFARLAGVVVFLAMIVVAEQRFLGGVLYRFWASTFTRLAVATAIAGAAEWLINGIFQSGWLSLVMIGLTGAIVYTAVLFMTGYLSQEEESMLKDLVANWRIAK